MLIMNKQSECSVNQGTLEYKIFKLEIRNILVVVAFSTAEPRTEKLAVEEACLDPELKTVVISAALKTGAQSTVVALSVDYPVNFQTDLPVLEKAVVPYLVDR